MGKLIITADGSLQDTTRWQTKYNKLRLALNDFLKKEYEKDHHPPLVSEFFEFKEIDIEMLELGGAETEDGSPFLAASHKKEILQNAVYETDSMIEFGNEEKYPESFAALKELSEMLNEIISIIPE